MPASSTAMRGQLAIVIRGRWTPSMLSSARKTPGGQTKSVTSARTCCLPCSLAAVLVISFVICYLFSTVTPNHSAPLAYAVRAHTCNARRKQTLPNVPFIGRSNDLIDQALNQRYTAHQRTDAYPNQARTRHLNMPQE